MTALQSNASADPETSVVATAQTDPLLSIKGVTLQYKTPQHLVTATYRVSFDIHPGERFILLGPSGCGKSTLLKSIAGFLPPTEGEIELKGRKITRPGPDRAMVFQEFDQLLPWKTVRENVAFPLKVAGVSAAEADKRALDVIDKVNLTKFLDVHPHMLSGGMKQRVAIARAMAMRPDVLLMDEPYAALDALTRRKMQDELLSLWDALGFTLVFVTHSIEEAVMLGTRILVLSAHPGQVRAEINTHQFTGQNTDSQEFGKTCARIREMLFGDAATAH